MTSSCGWGWTCSDSSCLGSTISWNLGMPQPSPPWVCPQSLLCVCCEVWRQREGGLWPRPASQGGGLTQPQCSPWYQHCLWHLMWCAPASPVHQVKCGQVSCLQAAAVKGGWQGDFWTCQGDSKVRPLISYSSYIFKINHFRHIQRWMFAFMCSAEVRNLKCREEGEDKQELVEFLTFSVTNTY